MREGGLSSVQGAKFTDPLIEINVEVFSIWDMQ